MRTSISKSVVKKLFALSGNICAFPNCNQTIIDENGNLNGQICHIEAANPEGERYNPNQTDEERNSFENLILLCPNHHLITNDVSIFTVEKLMTMKKNHEERFKKDQFPINQADLNKVLSSIVQKLSKIADDTKKSSKKDQYQMKLEFSTLIMSNPIIPRGEASPPCLGLTGMNIGERTITLSSWGFSFPNKNYLTQIPLQIPVKTPLGLEKIPYELVRFPYELQPGKSSAMQHLGNFSSQVQRNSTPYG